MKRIHILGLLVLLIIGCKTDDRNNVIITSDLSNYWEAYDKIKSTKDSVLQLEYLNTYFLDKASEGQKAMMGARRYQPQEYINHINQYPKFWESIRSNMDKVEQFAKDINSGIEKLEQYYPELNSSKVYFTVGAFRSPGTVVDRNVLIGSEMILTDENTDTSEFPDRLGYFSEYTKTNPINGVEFLNVHEFVHTQQKAYQYVLIYVTVYEGVAEFLAEVVTGKESTSPSMNYGKENDARVKEVFERVAFSSHAVDDWFYNDRNNEFGERDLGYYVGYQIASKVYNKAEDKKAVIKEMIELDFNNRTTFFDFVNRSGYFNVPLSVLETGYEKNIPRVLSIDEFENGSQQVNPNLKQITVRFSRSMQNRTDFDLGPLGMDALLRVQRLVGFSEDGKAVTFEVKLEPNKRYQLALGSNFRSDDGLRLRRYLIDFKTK